MGSYLLFVLKYLQSNNKILEHITFKKWHHQMAIKVDPDFSLSNKIN